MRRFWHWLSAALVVICLTPNPSVLAQSDPRQILGGMIYQVSTGTVNPNWYGAELWRTIANQTQNTGIYPQLRALGIVQDVVMTQWQQLPAGVLYAMSVQHAFGVSYWIIGIGTFTNRIEYATFSAGAGAGPVALPAPTPGPIQPATPTAPIGSTTPAPQPQPQPKPAPTPAQNEACKKFPSLC